MPNDKTNPVRKDGVVDFDCCLPARNRGWDANELLVELTLGADGRITKHIEGCRHHGSYHQSRAGMHGSITAVSVSGREFVVVVAERELFPCVLAEHLANEAHLRETPQGARVSG